MHKHIALTSKNDNNALISEQVWVRQREHDKHKTVVSCLLGMRPTDGGAGNSPNGEMRVAPLPKNTCSDIKKYDEGIEFFMPKNNAHIDHDVRVHACWLSRWFEASSDLCFALQRWLPDRRRRVVSMVHLQSAWSYSSRSNLLANRPKPRLSKCFLDCSKEAPSTATSASAS